MYKKLQDLSWVCLPKEVRSHIRSDYKYYLDRYKSVNSNTSKGAIDVLEDLFGHHNLTSDTDPEEMLYQKRAVIMAHYSRAYQLKCDKDEKWAFAGQEIEEVLYNLFGDKCLPDKESEQSNLCDTCSNELKDSPDCSYFDSCGIKSCSDYKSKEQPRPKFKVGDRMYIKYLKKIGTIDIVQGYNEEEDGIFYHLKVEPKGVATAREEYLDPYTEPETKDNMEEKELNRKALYNALCELETASVKVRKSLIWL